jgi:hypothetical protein
MRSGIVLGLGFALVFAGVAQAAVIINDDMEYASQAAFDAVWVPSGAGAQLSTAQSSSPTQSAYIDLTARRNDQNITPVVSTDAQPLVWKFMFYDSTGTGHARQYGQMLAGPSGLSELVAMGLYNNSGTIAEMSTYYSGRVAFGTGWFVLDDPGVVTRSVGWHELKAVIKGSTVDFYVDGTAGKLGVAMAGSGQQWYQARIGSGLSTANGDAYYDDYYLEQIPEPATLALLGLGGLFLRRRRA